MKAVVVAGGEVSPSDLALLADAQLVVAADGGARTLTAAGHQPDLLVGDLDSLDDETVTRLVDLGTQVEAHPRDKEASDTELAIERCLSVGADAVVLIGALEGERRDHALANVLLLAQPELRDVDLRIVHDGTTIRALHAGGELALLGAPGDLVSLLPVGVDAIGVTTRGLRWVLDGETLRVGRSRGLSNEVVSAPGSVRLDGGVLLVVEHSGA